MLRNWANICVRWADSFFALIDIDIFFHLKCTKKVKWWILSNDKWVKWMKRMRNDENVHCEIEFNSQLEKKQDKKFFT